MRRNNRYNYIHTSSSNSNNISLSHHFDTRIVELKELIGAKFEALEMATKLSSSNMERRLESMNEFRDAMKDQAAKFVTRGELIAYLISILAVLAAIVGVVLKI